MSGKPLKVLGALVVAVVVLAGLALNGPIRSGALLLLFRFPRPPVQHDLPVSYDPLHKGYVHSGTGLYLRQDEDLVLHGTPGFVLRRTYHSRDPILRQFGVGTTHNGEWYLRGDPHDLRWAELILEDATRIRFERISPGRAVSNAMFEHVEATSEYYSARLGWAAMFWAMRLSSGTLMLFKSCGHSAGDTCSIVKLRDSDGHLTNFRRDKSGILREIVAGSGSISFDYDDKGRIVLARDNSGKFVEYRYDEGGRLSSVTTSEGVVRKYTYNTTGQMLTIEEPRRFIQNTYENARCVLQLTDIQRSDGYTERFTFTWKYELRGDRIVATEVGNPDGTRRRYEFNERGYHISERVADQYGRSAKVTLHRDPVTYAVDTLSVSCFAGVDAPTRTETLRDRPVDRAVQELLRSCW